MPLFLTTMLMIYLRIITLTALLGLLSFSVMAQKKRLYLFEEYTNGTVLMLNNARANASLNYDAANRLMMYMEGEEAMILTNTQAIDTVFIADRKFIPAGRIFLEVVPLTSGEIYVNWLLNEHYRGKKGAYGQTTQNNIIVINTNHFQPGVYERQTADVNIVGNKNEYWLLRKGKYVKFKNEKGLLALFPDNKAQIRDYIRQHKLAISNPQDVFVLMEYIRTL